MTLVLGSSGSVGSYICKRLEEDNLGPITYGTRDLDNLPNGLHTVIWCQGYNVNDSIGALDFAEYNNCMNVNVHFIVKVNICKSIIALHINALLFYLKFSTEKMFK